MTGIFGAACTALLVATVMSKIELSSNEKYVLNATTEIQLSKDLKARAAEIIQAAWLRYKYKKLGSQPRIRKHQRRLFKAISGLQEAKAEKLDLSAHAVSLLDVSKKQITMADNMSALKLKQNQIENRMTNMEKRFDGVESLLAEINHRLKMIAPPPDNKRWSMT